MEGFLIIDKPAGITSFEIIRRLRRILGVKKMGHGGTLDPMATGVLVIGIGKATKKLKFLLGGSKEYEAEVCLGAVSDTYDRDGHLELRLKPPQFSPKKTQIQKVLKSFIGEIEQVPPPFSALKIKGRRAHDFARKGEKVVLKPRKVKIYSIGAIKFGNKKITKLGVRLSVVRFKISCSKGTYIRSLAHDLGEKLGCGAFLNQLKRTRVGDFTLKEALTLEKIRPEISLISFNLTPKTQKP